MKKISFLIVFFLLFGLTFSQNLSWKHVNVDLGVNIYSIMQDSLSRIIVLSEKGLFFLINLSQVEKIDSLLPDSIKISCFAINTKNELYAGTVKDGVFQYNEKDKKWVNISSKLEIKKIVNIAISSKDEIAVGTNGNNIYMLNPTDSSWKNLYFYGFPTFIKFNSDGDLFAALSYELLKFCSKPDWCDIPFDYQSYSLVNNINFNKSNSYISTNNKSIYVSKDSCKTWMNLIEGIGLGDIRILLFTKKDEIIAMSYLNGVFYSNNNGYSFEKNNNGLSSLRTISGVVLNDGKIVTSIQDEGLYISDAPKNVLLSPIGWDKKEKYWEKFAHPDSIEQIRFSNDGKTIFTVYKNEYKIWDAETGILIKQKSFSIINFYKIDISDDDSSCVLRSYVQGRDSIKIINKIFKISNDSLIKEYIEFSPQTYNDFYSLQFDESKADYDYIKNYFYSCNAFSYECEPGSVYLTISNGCFQMIDFNNGSSFVKKFSNSPVTSFLKLENNKYGFLVNDSYGEWSYGQGINNYWRVNKLNSYELNSNTLSLLSQISTNEKSKDPYLPIVSIRYLGNKKLIAGLITPNKIVFWDSDSNIRMDSCYLPQPVVDYQFSNDSRTIIAGFPTGIYLIRQPKMLVVDSIPFQEESGYNWKIAVSPDSNTFVFGSYDGMIRLVKNNWLTDIEESEEPQKSFLENQIIKISPNPSTDFLEISVGANGVRPEQTIEIFSVLGEKVLTTPALRATPPESGVDKMKIDVSSLTQGIYFVKVGDKMSKFVKI